MFDCVILKREDLQSVNFFSVNKFATLLSEDHGSQWSRGLRRRDAAARLLRLWVQIPPGHGCLSIVRVVCCQIEVSASG
jgi:hypothetical protein